jgi:hypothetical protein
MLELMTASSRGIGVPVFKDNTEELIKQAQLEASLPRLFR